MKEFILGLLDKWSCKHTWDLHRRVNTFWEKDKVPYKIKDTLICTKCGKIKKIVL